MKSVKRLAIACLACPAILCAAEATYRGILLFSTRVLYHEGQVFELYALGGSAAQGYPYSQDVGFPAIVSAVFTNKIQGRRIAVRVVSAPGNSGYADYLALRKTIRYRDKTNPAAVLILAGGNEVLSNPARGIAAFERLETLKEGLLGRSLFLSDLLFRAEKSLHWLGVRDMRTFEYYLRRTIETSLEAEAVPILATPAFNLSGIEPVNEIIRRGRNPEASSALKSGLALEDGRQYRMAIRFYPYMAKRHPGWHAIFAYRAGRSYQALRDYKAAKEHYWRAWNAEPIRQRNAIVERLAKEYHAPFVDAIRLFERLSPNGLIGNELFADEVHPNAMGNILLANAFAQELAARFKEPHQRMIESPEEIFRRTSYPAKLQACAWVTSGLSLLRGWPICPYIRQRIAAAKRDFENGARLNPGDAAAWFGLALTSAARQGKLAPEDFSARWFESSWVENTHCFRLAVAWEGMPGIMERFQEAQVPRAVLEHLAGLSPGRRPMRAAGKALELVGLDGWNVASGESSGLPVKDQALSNDALEASLDQKEYRDILPVLGAMTGQFPKDIELWLEQAHAAARVGRKRLVLESLAHVQALSPTPDQLHRMAIACQECRAYAQAVKILEGLLRARPGSAELLSDRGLCNYLNGSKEDAIQDLKAAIELDPRWLPPYLTLGTIYASAKRYDEALRLYNQALSMRSGEAMAPLRKLLESSRRDLREKTAKSRSQPNAWR